MNPGTLVIIVLLNIDIYRYIVFNSLHASRSEKVGMGQIFKEGGGGDR